MIILELNNLTLKRRHKQTVLVTEIVIVD